MSKVGVSPSLSTISRSITVGQAWAIGTALVLLTGGVFGFGVFVQSTRNESALLQKDREISDKDTTIVVKNNQVAEKDRTIGELTTKVGDLQRTVDTLTTHLQQTLVEKDALDPKLELLNRLVFYLQSHDETNKKLLENVVCSMWKQSEHMRIQLERRPITISAADLRRGLPPDVERLLVTRGVSSELLGRIRNNDFLPREQPVRVAPFGVTKPVPVNPANDPGQAIAVVQKGASSVTVVKVITFADGSRYEMPQEIAAAVHSRTDCAP